MSGQEGEFEPYRNVGVARMILYPELKNSVLVIEIVQHQFIDIMESKIHQVMIEDRLGTVSPLECVEAQVNPSISNGFKKHGIAVEQQ